MFQGSVILKLLRVHKWKLQYPLTYITPDDEKIIVPKDFLTDGASIPKVFWSIFGGPLSGRYIKSAIVHDYLCVLNNQDLYSRERADKIFEWAMAEEGATLPKRKAMWLGARLGALGKWISKLWRRK